jgi:hypothetical protein
MIVRKSSFLLFSNQSDLHEGSHLDTMLQACVYSTAICLFPNKLLQASHTTDTAMHGQKLFYPRISLNTHVKVKLSLCFN